MTIKKAETPEVTLDKCIDVIKDVLANMDTLKEVLVEDILVRLQSLRSKSPYTESVKPTDHLFNCLKGAVVALHANVDFREKSALAHREFTLNAYQNLMVTVRILDGYNFFQIEVRTTDGKRLELE